MRKATRMSHPYYGPVLRPTREFTGHQFGSATAFGGPAKGVANIMRRKFWLSLVLLITISGKPASAQGLLGGLLSNLGSTVSSLTKPQPGVIVRTNVGLGGLKLICLLHACSVVGNLDGNVGQLYLVRSRKGLLPHLLSHGLALVMSIVDPEPDQRPGLRPDPPAPHTSNTPPAGLWETSPVK